MSHFRDKMLFLGALSLAKRDGPRAWPQEIVRVALTSVTLSHCSCWFLSSWFSFFLVSPFVATQLGSQASSNQLIHTSQLAIRFPITVVDLSGVCWKIGLRYLFGIRDSFCCSLGKHKVVVYRRTRTVRIQNLIASLSLAGHFFTDDPGHFGPRCGSQCWVLFFRIFGAKKTGRAASKRHFLFFRFLSFFSGDFYHV